MMKRSAEHRAMWSVLNEKDDGQSNKVGSNGEMTTVMKNWRRTEEANRYASIDGACGFN